ncbi:type VI secretion protein IcmF/TssM N-terminal domain-containing protein [Desulfogranum mediterraneum]|uniref:type VI secretion protein IcmF/TssM N-terminal domain-containing protein n=1 Tax=Desulfogranum mediterraneum TaxID=160661 RepID=UPI00041CAFD2|nr:type VI secretion protein IcmF/TssM N-terminal domain-containing protein [Desulfogranum mediterraneum]
MPKSVKIIIALVTFLVVAALAAAAAYWSYFSQHWPWWIALSMAAGVFALYFLLLFLKKYLIRRREKRFVRRVVEHGEVLAEGERPERQNILELEQSWKANLEILKHSHLKKRGNPLYVLPWYLAMGETGVGKSTMLANAGVASSFTELEDQKGLVRATRSCDWFFFDQAILLDSAGRYSVPLASDEEQNEWKHFLLLLARHRRKEPLNGILLFVAADDLLNTPGQALRKKAQILRNRIHSLMRTIGFKVPVTVMVTKMDLIPGFSELAALLSAQEREQVMGRLNNQATPYWQEFLAATIADVDQGLQRIRLNKIGQPQGRNGAFFSFPAQLASLAAGLESFLEVLFSENAYQETPLLQGIYLGSGRCGRTSASGALPTGAAEQAGSAAVFVRELFSTVLPAHRRQLEPVKELLLWRKMTRNLALISWLCMVIFAGGMIGLSYLHNQQVFALFPKAEQTIVSEQNGRNAVIVSLEKMRLNILEIETANSRWALPLPIFSAAERAEAAYKRKFCRLMATSLIHPMEQGFSQAVADLSADTSADLYADYIGYLVEQINYLKAALAGKKLPPFHAFTRVATTVLSINSQEVLADVGRFFPDLNASYLAWSRNRTDIEERLLALQGTLKDLLTKNGGASSWLYAQSITDTPPLTLADFWKVHQTAAAGRIEVPGAFSQRGRAKIEDFFRAIEQAGISRELIGDLRQGYLNSYPQQFVHWWKAFGLAFIDGELGLDTDTDWREEAIRMAGPGNPYFLLLETLSRELAAFSKETGSVLPEWGKAVIAINEIRTLALSSKKSKDAEPSLFARIASEKNRITTETLQQVDPAKAAEMVDKLKLAEAWSKYEAGLTGLKVITPYREKAAAQFSSWFKQADSPEPSQSGLAQVYEAWVSLKSLAQERYDTPFVWKLVYGPFNFLQDFAARDTAQVLQQKWQEEVLSLAAHVDPDKRTAFLFDREHGVVWKYFQDYAAPFVRKSVNGYTARTLYGRTLVFKPSFYSLLNQAKLAVIHTQPHYRVTMTTKPMAVNEQAGVEPYYSIFSMQCAKQSYILENDNFPQDLTIDWAPESCGEVSLKIGFPTMELSKKWSGALAFAHFLQQFQTGGYRFTAKDFPADAGHLEEKKIEYISIGYTLSGTEEIVRLLHKVPQKLPKQVLVPEQQLAAKPQTDTQAERLWPQPLPITAQREQGGNSAGGGGYRQGTWLLAQDPKKYTVQIMSLQAAASIAQGFSAIAQEQSKAVYSRLIKGVRWHILLAGRFDSRAAAQGYLKSLPPALRKGGAFVRSFGDVQQELR